MRKNEIFTVFKDKKVLITGHTGFKGSWLSLILQMAGAQVCGYSLAPNSSPALFEVANISENMKSVIGDVRDLQSLQSVFSEFQPEYVFHLAAQPIVRESYKNPVETYSTNVMGTVNLLECVRNSSSVKSVINITTDKVYLNEEREEGYTEDEKLDGYDPYSNSKSCSELVTHSYYQSFLKDKGICVSTARAGNVIGGGDFEKDRIIPDCVRAALAGNEVIVRNPNSVRPYQHVLEPLYVYLMIAARQVDNPNLQGAYNVGPDESDCWTTAKIVNEFCKVWNDTNNGNLRWENLNQSGPHEANILKLNCDKLKNSFGWKPTWNIQTAINEIVSWTKVYCDNGDILAYMKETINKFIMEID